MSPPAHGLWLVGDAAQSFGASYRGRNVGQLAPADDDELLPGQAARLLRRRRRNFLTDDDDLAATMRSLRVHGQGSRQVRHVYASA